ncbi:MAG: efflux RND transporter periplasmic adaptor subunit [Syntrophales bacterium]
MNRIIILFICIFLLLCTGGCAKEEKAKAEKVQAVNGIKVGTVASSTVEDIYEAVGTVRSKTTSVLSSRIMGKVLNVHVREGNRVKTGQLLVEIDDREAVVQMSKTRAGERESKNMLQEVEKNIKAAESAKGAAQASSDLAKATFNRYQTLLERKSVSRQEFDEVKARHQAGDAEVNRADEMIQSLFAKKGQVLARIEQAQADVISAQLTAGYSRITSPMNGIVVSKQAEIGIMAAPGMPLISIEDNSRYHLETMVMESQMGKIRVGNPVQVVIDALDRMVIPGKVSEIIPIADPATRKATVKIDLAFAAKKGEINPVLRSGSFGKALFPAGQRTLIMLPPKALIRRGQLLGVYVIDSGNIAHLRLIQTGKSYGDQIEVVSGLREGEKIVIEGIEEVNEGNRVKE